MTSIKNEVKPLDRKEFLHNIEGVLVSLQNSADVDIVGVYALYVKETTATAGAYSVELYTKNDAGDLVGIVKLDSIAKIADTADVEIIGSREMYALLPGTDKRIYAKCIGAAGQKYDLWGAYAEDKE